MHSHSLTSFARDLEGGKREQNGAVSELEMFVYIPAKNIIVEWKGKLGQGFSWSFVLPFVRLTGCEEGFAQRKVGWQRDQI